MSDKQEDKPWWFPQLTDGEWIAQIRGDYPEETAGMDDEDVRSHYADGWKYADTWDHLGDAREEYEKLADAYLELRSRIEDAPILDGYQAAIIHMSGRTINVVSADLVGKRVALVVLEDGE